MIRARVRKQFRLGGRVPGFTLNVAVETTACVTALFGSAGAGKTLLLNCIAGFVTPDVGRILLNDRLLYDGAAGVNLPPRSRDCGYIFPRLALFPHLSLQENLHFASRRRPRLDRHRKVTELLERFDLTSISGRKPHEVTRVERFRCALARALVGAPKMLLLDELAAGLSTPERDECRRILRPVAEEFELPILLATGDLEDCFELAGEMLVLSDGRIVHGGPPRGLVESPSTPEVARLLGIYNLLEVEIVQLDPQRKSSRVRYRDFELAGPYFRGRLRGDRVWLCVRPQEIRLVPRNGKPGPNQIPVEILRISDLPYGARVELSGGIRVDVPREEFEGQKHNKEWWIEFAKDSLRAL